MNVERAVDIRHLRELKNISWHSSRQLKRLAVALSVSAVDRGDVIIAEKHSPEDAYILLAGVARISCRNRKGDRTLVIMVAAGLCLLLGHLLYYSCIDNITFSL
jgi:hypothetical protein